MDGVTGGVMGSVSRSRRVFAATCMFGAMVACRGSRNGDTDQSGYGAHTDGAAPDGPTAFVAAVAPPPDDDAVPPATSDELTTRARHLLEAIAKDDPPLGTDIEFPRDAWLGTRDASNAGKDWDRHVAGPFRRAIHALAHRHKDMGRAQLISIEVGRAMVQATPKKHAWKKPLWVVRESRITFVVDGRTRTLAVREMTAWRGAWYVTRLR